MFKPMKTLGKRLFRQNRGRNLVAVLAIILTTLMFTTLFVLSQSISQNLLEMTFRQTGYDAQASFKGISEAQAAKIAAHPNVEEVGNSIVLALAQNQRLAGRQVEIRWADDSYAAHSFAAPTTGRMPQSADEVALDTITLDRLGIPHELGQSVTLEWLADMTKDEVTVSTFTLCGFWAGNESSYASMAWVSRDFVDSFIDAAGGAIAGQILGLRMAQVNLYSDSNIESTMDGILADTGLTELEYGVNLAYTPEMGVMAAQESAPMYVGMALVFLAGYLIIYNIFQISVTADIQFYGKLKTLGTTKKQLKRLIYGQAGRLCIIGIPIGLILGYLLGAVLVPVLVSFQDGKVSVSASPLIFIGSALFAALTVFISCLRPARMAGKVSPMEALRYNDVQDVGRKRKKHQGTASLGSLAWSNLWRNRKRTITVICSLTLGLTLMSCFYAKNAAFDMEKYLESMIISDYQINTASSEEYITGYNPQSDTLNTELLALVDSLDGLEAAGHLYSHETTIDLDDQTIANLNGFYTQDMLDYWNSYDPSGPAALAKALENRTASSTIYGLDGIPLDVYSGEQYWLNGGFDAEKFATGNYVLAVGPAMEGGLTEQVMPTVSVGRSVTIEGRSYEVMAVLNPLGPITDGALEGGPNENFYLDFIMPASTFCQNWPENTVRKLYFNVSDDCLNAAQDVLDGYAADQGSSLDVSSRQSMIAQYERQTQSSAVMGNAISVVIALVGVLNFINSMVTAIVSRKKEFAMMQSVGMTKVQLRKLLVFEGLDYAWLTLLISYAVSSLAIEVVVRAMVEGGFTTFRFTLLPLVVCTPILLAFAVLIPFLCFKNLEKDSLVERLRATD